MQIAIGKEAISKRGELITQRKDEVGIKEEDNKDLDMEYDKICCRNMDIEEGGYTATGSI